MSPNESMECRESAVGCAQASCPCLYLITPCMPLQPLLPAVTPCRRRLVPTVTPCLPLARRLGLLEPVHVGAHGRGVMLPNHVA
jgi:hypothetical protein